MAALLAGLPESVAGVTVNRLCASGLSAVVGAAHAIAAGDGDLFVAGGVESMSRAPLVTAKPDAAFPRGDRTMYDTTLGWRFPNPRLAERFPLETMGETGENVADALGDLARGPGRLRPAVAAALVGRRLRRRARRRRRPRARRAPAPGHDAREARLAQARLPRRAARSRPATRAGSTTAPPRSCSPPRRRHARSARSRSARSSRAPSPASIRA